MSSRAISPYSNTRTPELRPLLPDCQFPLTTYLFHTTANQPKESWRQLKTRPPKATDSIRRPARTPCRAKRRQGQIRDIRLLSGAGASSGRHESVALGRKAPGTSVAAARLRWTLISRAGPAGRAHRMIGLTEAVPEFFVRDIRCPHVSWGHLIWARWLRINSEDPESSWERTGEVPPRSFLYPAFRFASLFSAFFPFQSPLFFVFIFFPLELCFYCRFYLCRTGS